MSAASAVQALRDFPYGWQTMTPDEVVSLVASHVLPSASRGITETPGEGGGYSVPGSRSEGLPWASE